MRQNRFITDYLLAEFATQKKQHEWRGASSSLKQLIKNKFNVDLSKSNIDDGSGISRLNLLTVNQLDSFLSVVSKKSNFASTKSLMAIPREECTLRDRFKDVTELYVKTGSLSNVSALVGYFYDKRRELHSFVIMSNNFFGDHEPYRGLEEAIISIVAAK